MNQLILIRHGQSESNVDKVILSTKPDYLISLTELGKQQAFEAGQKLATSVKSALFYVSPFLRAKETLDQIVKSVRAESVIEDIRVREQDIGNFIDDPNKIHSIRDRHNRFFYRFPDGESLADVYVRVKQFLIDEKETIDSFDNVVIVTHAGTMRVFEMIRRKLTALECSKLSKPKNCEIQYV